MTATELDVCTPTDRDHALHNEVRQMFRLIAEGKLESCSLKSEHFS